MLTIHHSNRYEVLAGRLLERIGQGAASPFEPDTVIVPSTAVRRHLTLAIARRHGVCANVAFAYLAQWLWRVLAPLADVAVAARAAESPFAPEVLAWRIDAAFDDRAWTAGHPRLAGYLAEADAVTRHALAARVAAVFDRYLTYRPDWIAAWTRGEAVGLPPSAGAVAQDDAAWQAALWRRLVAAVGMPHPLPAFEAALRAGRPVELPRVVHVFALPDLAPAHWRLLRTIGARTDVELYLLNPSGEFWFDVVGPRRLAALSALGKAAHHEVGHRLLASWGAQAQSQLGMVFEADEVADAPAFETPAGASLLARLQRSILELHDLEPGSVALAEGDRSIEIHLCHSATRELEVLHDRLLDLFAQPDPPAPADVVVVTPDLDATAPLVDAVFGTAPRERFIPYTITGRARSTVNAPARALLALLALVGSRAPVSAVAGVLALPVVARRFGLDDDALARLRHWLRQAGVHWALEPAQRAEAGLEDAAPASLDEGLARLMLGYALPSDAALPLAGVLPAGGAEGQAALALGALAAFAQALIELRRAVAQPRPAADWPALVESAIAGFIDATDDEADDLAELRAALRALADTWARAGVTRALPLVLVREALAERLDAPARGGVPTGAVTFSAIGSLRALPYRIVCAIGLNDGAFPSPARPDEFDLISHAPRAGDRQRRTDDRGLFLDLLLAARERVHLSAVGRSVRDNSPRPPSVLVDELLDELLAAIRPADALRSTEADAALRARLVVEHPLQPFAPELFEPGADPRRASFVREYAEALRQRAGPIAGAGLTGAAPSPGAAGVAGAAGTAAPDAAGHPEGGVAGAVAGSGFGVGGRGTEAAVDGSDNGDLGDAGAFDADAGDHAAGGGEFERPEWSGPPFFAAPLPDVPSGELPSWTLDALTAFFRHPCRALLRDRLGLALPRAEGLLADEEPLAPDREAQRALAGRLWPLLLGGASDAEVQAVARAGTAWPGGAVGEAWLAGELAALRAHAEAVRAATAQPCLPPLAVRIELPIDGAPWTLEANFADLRPQGLVRHLPDRLGARDRLDAWIRHLVLCAAAPADAALCSTVLARGETAGFGPVEQPHARLADLLRLARRGLREPLPLFPRSSWAFVESNGRLAAAAGQWRVRPDRPWGEEADPWIRLALRGRPDPLAGDAEEFVATARAVYGPLLDAMRSADEGAPA